MTPSATSTHPGSTVRVMGGNVMAKSRAASTNHRGLHGHASARIREHAIAAANAGRAYRFDLADERAAMIRYAIGQGMTYAAAVAEVDRMFDRTDGGLVGMVTRLVSRMMMADRWPSQAARDAARAAFAADPSDANAEALAEALAWVERVNEATKGTMSVGRVPLSGSFDPVTYRWVAPKGARWNEGAVDILVTPKGREYFGVRAPRSGDLIGHGRGNDRTAPRRVFA